MRPQIVSVLLNTCRNDSRVLKVALSLAGNAYSVIIAGIWEAGLAERELLSDSAAVHRFKLATMDLGKNFLIQLIKYLEFLLRFLRLYGRASFLHCNDLAALPIGVAVKLFTNRSVKIIYDCHELETETKTYSGWQKFLVKIAEKILIRYADAVITVNDSIAHLYSSRYSIPLPAVVMNCPSYRRVDPAEDSLRRQLGIPPAVKLFLYLGGLSAGRGIRIILEAFKNLDATKYAVVFVGSGIYKEKILEYAAACTNIFLCEAVPADHVVQYASSADFGLSIIENICLSYYYSTPSKLFEYIMALLPVVVSDVYEQRRIVSANQIGLVLEEESVEELCRAVVETEKLAIHSIQATEQRLARHYCWEAQEEVLLRLYAKLSEGA